MIRRNYYSRLQNPPKVIIIFEEDIFFFAGSSPGFSWEKMAEKKQSQFDADEGEIKIVECD